MFLRHTEILHNKIIFFISELSLEFHIQDTKMSSNSNKELFSKCTNLTADLVSYCAFTAAFLKKCLLRPVKQTACLNTRLDKEIQDFLLFFLKSSWYYVVN